MFDTKKDEFALVSRLEEMVSKPWARFLFKPYEPKTIFRRRVSYLVMLEDKEAFVINGDGVFKFGMELPMKKRDHTRLLELVVAKAKEKKLQAKK